MHPKYLSIKNFSYNLPEEMIAKYPLAERDASKLLIWNQGKISEDIFRNINNHIPADSLLIFNDTKVIEARILFQKNSGGIIEIFCLEPAEHYPDITTAMMQKGNVLWNCLIGGASKWKHGQVLEKKIHSVENEITLRAAYIKKLLDSFVIEFSWTDNHLSFAEILHQAGAIPLPPYIKRDAEPLDNERYQTIFAAMPGSVAAPTAGLHFTDFVFERLKSKNIQKDFVTLHVGAGTFKPVKAEIIQQHLMHPEFIYVRKSTIKNLIQNLDNNIIAIGTTALRAIESMYWLGLKINISPNTNPYDLHLPQWEPYDVHENKNIISVELALKSLLQWMDKNQLDQLFTKTQLIIIPGYHVKLATALITNFHLPRSTLLLLVAALIGDAWKKIYNYALQNEFRFLSYGDANLLWIKQ